MPLSQADFDTLCQSLERASDVLRAGGCLLQAVARRYYLVYIVACQAASKHGVSATHSSSRGDTYPSQKFHHNEAADLIFTLYTGQARGNVRETGTCPGIVGNANFTERDAMRAIEKLHFDRKRADYGTGSKPEPYDEATADERLKSADLLAEDLRKLL